jgi:integrase
MGELLVLPERTRKRPPTKKVPLTDNRVEKLTGQGFHWDAKVDGLAVRITKAGAKSFVFRRQVHGRLVNITLGKTSGMTVEDARRAVLKINGNIADGRDIRAERRADRAKAANKPLTLGDAFEAFKGSRERRPSTQTDYEFLWRDHVPAGLKRKAVVDIERGDIEAAKQALRKKRRTANKVVVLLAAILSKAGRWADNPARGVQRYRENVRTRRLNPDELVRVWSALEGEREWGDFFRLLILTGARRTPFCAMRWADLDLDAGVWMIPAEWAKSRREMAIPLAGEAVRILREHRAAVSGCEWVWPSPDSASGHVVEPKKSWWRVLNAAGVTEHTTLHDVRRTLGSRLAMGGVAGATISKVLGHVSSQSLKAYAHLDVTAGREAIERTMAGVLDRPLSAEEPDQQTKG